MTNQELIDNVAELNRVLLITRALGGVTDEIEIDKIITACRGIAIQGKMPEHENSIYFSVKLGLLQLSSTEDKCVLTAEGQKFIELNVEELYDLTNEQRRYLIRKHFLDGVLKRPVRKCLKCFEMSATQESFVWSETDGIPILEERWVLKYLTDLGLLWRRKDKLIVKKTYVKTIDLFLSENKGWTEDQFFEYLNEKKELGNLAEKLVFEWERKRLFELGHEVESHCVQDISKQNVSAGYDIKSFDGSSTHINFDRFIEVKGSKGDPLRFIWSENEMNVAKELGDKYWIYFLGGIHLKSKTAKFKPLMFQNPIKSILEHQTLTISNQGGLLIMGNLKAELAS